MTSRRAGARLLVGAIALALVAGCSSRASTTETEQTTPPSTVTVDSATGKVTVDVTSERVWALDEYAALQLLALGVTPVGVGQYMDDAASASVLTDAGITLSRPSDVEVIAAARPELVVGIGHPEHLELEDRLEQVAPVVNSEFTSPWTDQLTVLGEVTGTAERARAVTEAVERETAELETELAESDVSGGMVSMLTTDGEGVVQGLDQTSLSGQVVERLGFERPRSQVNDDDEDFGFGALSEEALPDQGGDVILSFVWDDTDPSVLDNPVFAPQVKAATHTADVEGSVWLAPTPLSAWWILQDLRALLLDGGEPADLDAVTERWADLMSGL
jgi:iron complex transport system substrate-binding protein